MPAGHDIDLCLVLDEREYGRVRSTTPERCLRLLYEAIVPNLRQGWRVQVQNRSLGILGEPGGPRFDLVPVFRHPRMAHVYHLPDRQRGAWILTSPEAHQLLTQRANQRTRHLLNRLIRCAKRWNVRCGKPLKSFHLEVMAYGAFQAPPPGLRGGLVQLFRHLAAAVLRPCPDPAALGPAIDDDLPERQRVLAQRQLLRACDVLETAR